MKILQRILLLIFCLSLLSPAWATDYCADTNTVSAFRMEDASGNLTDCSTYGNNMAATGSPGTYQTTGKYDFAFDFTQTNNAGFSSTDTADIRNIRNISVGAWTDPDTDGAADGVVGSTIVAKWDGADGWLFGVMSGTGPINFKFRYQWTGGAASWRTTTAPVTLGGGSFQHLAVTYDSGSTSNNPVLYYNGVSQSQNEDNTPFSSPDDDTGGEPTIGIDGDGTGTATVGEYDGDLDEVFVRKITDSSVTINDIKDCGLDGAECASASRRYSPVIAMRYDRDNEPFYHITGETRFMLARFIIPMKSDTLIKLTRR